MESEKKAGAPPSKLQLVCDAVWLALTSVVLLVVFITSGLSNDTAYGFKNTTGDVSDIFFTQVSTCLLLCAVTISVYVYICKCYNFCVHL